MFTLCLCCTFLSQSVLAQQELGRQPAVEGTILSPIEQPQAMQADEIRIVEPPVPVTVGVVEQHSPSKALYLSFMPGAGQVYNRQAWKVPVIYALMGASIYWSYSSYGNMKMFRDEYLHRVNGGDPELERYVNYPNSSIYNMYTSYNQDFQLGIVLAVLVYGLNLLDAYVYGHLFDFQIDNDISLSVSPALLPPDMANASYTPAFSLSLKF